MYLALLNSLISGMIASFTPCVLVLFPIVMYRFMKDEKLVKKDYFLFILGFLSSFLLAGFVLFNFLNSSFQNVVKFVLGFFLITLGALELFNKINTLNIKPIMNTYLYGFLFAFAVSISPCALPFLGSMIGLGINFNMLINFLLFGLGLLTPSFLFLFVSKNILSKIMKSKKYLYYFSKFMSIILILTGAYISLTITNLKVLEIYISGFILFLLIFFIFFTFLKTKKLKEFLFIPRLILFLSLISFLAVYIFSCSSDLNKKNNFNSLFKNNFNNKGYDISMVEQTQCGYNTLKCEICMKCFKLFSITLFLTFAGNFLLLIFDKKKNKG